LHSLGDLMDAMADKLETALGSAVNQVVPRLNFNPTPPSVDIYPGDPFGGNQAAGFGQSGEVVFTVRCRATTADHEAGQDVLLAFMDGAGTLSIAAALEADQTLDGLAGSVYVEGPSGYTVYPDSGNEGGLLGCEFRVTVLRAFS
jgi:hypothetical protein